MRIVIALIASLVISAACSDSNSPPAQSPLKSITIAGGNGQTGAAGEALPDSIIVVATYSNGKPSVKAGLIYGPSGGGSVAFKSAVTDNSGRAAVAWTLDPSAAKDTLTIAVEDPTNPNHILFDSAYATAAP